MPPRWGPHQDSNPRPATPITTNALSLPSPSTPNTPSEGISRAAQNSNIEKYPRSILVRFKTGPYYVLLQRGVYQLRQIKINTFNLHFVPEANHSVLGIYSFHFPNRTQQFPAKKISPKNSLQFSYCYCCKSQ